MIVIDIVFLVFSSGYFLVKFDVIGLPGIKVLSKLSQYLFLPFLLLQTLGSSLSLEALENTWIMPVLGIVVTLFNFTMGKFVILPIAKPTKQLERFFLLGQTFSNFIAMPLVLVAAICSQIEFEKPEYLKENKNNTEFFTEDECVEQGNLYMFMFSIFILFAMFTCAFEYVNGQVLYETVEDEDKTSRDKKVNEGNQDEHRNEDHRNKEIQSAARFTKKFQQTMRKQCHPINIAQIMGILIGLITPIREAIFSEDGILRPIGNTINIFGDGSVSVVNIILSATLSLKLLSLPSWKYIFGDMESIGASQRTLLSYALSKVVILPVLGLLIFMTIQFHVFSYMPEDDKLLQTIFYIELIMPSANLVVVIAQITHQTKNAEILAIGVLLQYMIGMFTLTGFTFFILYSLNLTE